MSHNSHKSSLSVYDSKVFLPIILCLALMGGLFQNCSSKFTTGIDPIKNQIDALNVTPVRITDQPVSIKRLEGSSLYIAPLATLFQDQGLDFCNTATYNWSYQPSTAGAGRVALAEKTSVLSFANLSMANEGDYYLDVNCRSQNYSLGPVQLDIVPKLRLVNSNVTNQTVNEGSPAALNAQFSGPSPIAYQWYFKQLNGSRVALAGQTSQTLNIASAQVSDQGDYELVATSNEGGFSQSLSAGPGRLTVVSMSAVSGSVSGTTQVVKGQPISLSSTVSGLSSPQYQWYHNAVAITGGNSASLSIPSSDMSDAGVYSLRVSEAGKTYQVGSINVTVICAAGQSLVGNQCLAASKICSVSNGTGIQFLKPDGTYESCQVTACSPGYVNINNKCVSGSSPCPIENGTGLTSILPDGSFGACVVQSCNAGYININNSCQRKVCPVQNGIGFVSISGGVATCEIQYCDPDYVKYNGACVARTQSCPISNGVGERTFTSSGPGACNVKSCNSGYVSINNRCELRNCAVPNGQGIIALSSTGGIQCKAVSCNAGYFLYNNSCVSQTCTAHGGSGYWTIQNGQRLCNLTKCNGADLFIHNNKCISTLCPISNGRGAVALDANGQIYCKAVSCNSGYTVQGNVCVSTSGKACSIPNGSGVTNSSGQCVVTSCNSGYVNYNNQCVKSVQSCSIVNGVGSQTFTVNGPGVCTVRSCNTGYTQQGNTCVPKTQSCNIQNGQGVMTTYANGFSTCVVKSCNAGYGKTITEQCLPLEKPCYVGTGKGVQYLTSYGYSACKIQSCPVGQSLIRGACTKHENLLCEPAYKSKSAYGGKVYGQIFSLLNHTYNANLNTATLESNRLNGQVFLQKVSFGGTDYLRNVSNQLVRHANGTALKNWFGLKLYTQILPPDGAWSGRYLLALASDDGSSLHCKVDGSWRTFVNHSSSNSCSNLRAAIAPVEIRRDRPMPVMVKYFQNAGAGRCLKLYYKRYGTSDAFKEIPRGSLMLPDGTLNRCPNATY